MKYVGLGKKSFTFKQKASLYAPAFCKNDAHDGKRIPDFFMNNLEKIIGGLFLILFLGGLYVK